MLFKETQKKGKAFLRKVYENAVRILCEKRKKTQQKLSLVTKKTTVCTLL